MSGKNGRHLTWGEVTTVEETMFRHREAGWLLRARPRGNGETPVKRDRVSAT